MDGGENSRRASKCPHPSARPIRSSWYNRKRSQITRSLFSLQHRTNTERSPTSPRRQDKALPRALLPTAMPHLLSYLIDEDECAAGVVQDGRQLAQRLAHQPSLREKKKMAKSQQTTNTHMIKLTPRLRNDFCVLWLTRCLSEKN